MKPADFFYEATYPLRHSAPFAAILSFGLLSGIALQAAEFAITSGYWPALGFAFVVSLIILPATVRYPLLLIEARAQGVDPAVPGPEILSWLSDWWSLFPLVHIAKWIALAWFAGDVAGETGVVVIIIVSLVLNPAELAVLAVTRSPLDSLNPLTLYRLIARIGASYLAVPAALLLLIGVELIIPSLPLWLGVLIGYFACSGFYAVVGGMVRPFELFDEVQLATVEPTVEKKILDLVKSRTEVLNHAYGLASRGNFPGALDHISGWLETDEPYPGDGWPWFFDAMLKWEDSFPALKLAQRYLDVLLAAGEDRAAAKLMLRCRHLSDQFRPSTASKDRALEAAQTFGNPELETWLSRL